jgi:2-polyprenyl-3-methyl-5-hydroxy-6-metoxy-1,4-benzoquinol methylase
MNALTKTHLRLSEHFALTYDSNGQAILFSFLYPERNFRISDTMRVLISCFPANKAVEISDAVATYCRHCQIAEQSQVANAALAAISKLVHIGALVPQEEQQAWSGPYSSKMYPHYAQSRQVPLEICARIAEAGKIQRETAVLDIGTGPGSIAVHLGLTSANVIGVDISENFLKIARTAAEFEGSNAKFECMDANKLIFRSTSYEIITASQVMVWLDPAWAVRGIDRSLRPNGSVFFVETKPVLWAGHPFRKLFKFGNLGRSTVLNECSRHAAEYQKLFKVLSRSAYIMELSGMWVFRQSRPFDIGFARAYFFSQQISNALPGQEDPMATIEEQLSKLPANRVNGEFYWLLLKFTKRSKMGATVKLPRLEVKDIVDIPYGLSHEQR